VSKVGDRFKNMLGSFYNSGVNSFKYKDKREKEEKEKKEKDTKKKKDK